MSQLPPQAPSFLQFIFEKVTSGNLTNEELTRYKNDVIEYYSNHDKQDSGIILTLSVNGEITSGNISMVNGMLGYSPDENINYKQNISEESYLDLQSAFSMAKKGSTEIREITVYHKDNEPFFTTTTFIPINAKDSSVESVFLLLEDMTPQRKLENVYNLEKNQLVDAKQITDMGSFVYIVEEDIVYCSESFYEIFDLAPLQHATLEILFSRVDEQYYEEINQLLQKATESGINYEADYSIHLRNTDEHRYIREYVEAIKENGKVTRLVGTVKDITAYKELEDHLLETNARYRHIFDHLDVGFWMREMSEGKLTYVSKGLTDILHLPMDLLYREPDYWKDMIVPADKQEVFDNYKNLYSGESVSHVFKIDVGDNILKWIYEQTIPKLDSKGNITQLFGMVMDITSKMEAQRKLEFLASNDALTSLPNQQSLYVKIDEMYNDELINSFALIYIDLDDFTWVTDYLGYQISDKILKKVAQKLVGFLKPDYYLANISSDKFVLLIPNYSDKKDVKHLAKEMIEHIGEKMNIKGYEIYVTASIGISFCTEYTVDKNSVLENAHTALYHAKSLGKNNYQVYSYNGGAVDSYRKYLLEKDLREAINKNELEVYYQPQVNPQTGGIEGAEALIRWNHKDWGIISPSEFIGLAEQKHLIHNIGAWVIEQACQDLNDWRDKGYDLFPVSVNVSPIQFLKKELVTTVEQQLIKYDIPPQYLELEITESTFLKNEKQVITMLEDLNKLGVRIGLDDFGKGYSSLRYLRDFEIDTLKIDQLFIRSLSSTDDKNLAIVSSILNLGNQLNMRIVAEGVEEFEQLEVVRAKGCHIIQGYLYSKPVQKREFEKMILKGFLVPSKVG